MENSGGYWPAGDGIDIDRVRAEVEAEAEERRRRDPETARLERHIERAWTDVSPPGAGGPENERLLDRAEWLAELDADVETGRRPGIRLVKAAIRKLIRWYLKYIVDQFNAFSGVLLRLLRHLDERVSELEAAIRMSADDADLLWPPPEPSAATAAAVADAVGPGRCLVLSCGEGAIVDAIEQRNGNVYGIERDPRRIVDGVRRGLDLRSVDLFEHMAQIHDGELGTIVLAGAAESLPIPTLWRLVGESDRVLSESGTVVVAVSDPARREGVEAEIRAGRGAAPSTWQHLLAQAGLVARVVPAPGPRITELVVAERP